MYIKIRRHHPRALTRVKDTKDHEDLVHEICHRGMLPSSHLFSFSSFHTTTSNSEFSKALSVY